MQKILVGGEMNSVINFAMQQNYVPVFRSLLITNKSEETLENITFRITFEPDFAHTFETVIPRLMPSEAFELACQNCAEARIPCFSHLENERQRAYRGILRR